jgi:transposase-like protein
MISQYLWGRDYYQVMIQTHLFGCLKHGIIITDQDRAMKSAIARIFPRVRHRFCLWHIVRKFPKKLESHAQYTCGLKNAIDTCLYDSQTCVEFDESWQSLLENYNL